MKKLPLILALLAAGCATDPRTASTGFGFPFIEDATVFRDDRLESAVNTNFWFKPGFADEIR